MNTQTGRITFISEKGFGFVRPDDRSADRFWHVTGLVDRKIDAINVGDRVSFEVEFDTRTGREKAVQVRAL